MNHWLLQIDSGHGRVYSIGDKSNKTTNYIVLYYENETKVITTVSGIWRNLKPINLI